MHGSIHSITDIEDEKNRKRKIKIFIFFLFLGMGILSYPAKKNLSPKSRVAQAARKLAEIIADLKMQAIVSKTPRLVKIKYPDLLEIFEVENCSSQNEKKISEIKVSNLAEGVLLADPEWVDKSGGQKKSVLSRFCYDPLAGSSLKADGLDHGEIYLVPQVYYSAYSYDQSIEVIVEGENAELSIE